MASLPLFTPMSATMSTSLANVVGVSPTEVYALSLMSFSGQGEHIAHGILESLTRKGYVANSASRPGRFIPMLTEKAKTLLASLHR